jgi:hypothetical protein
MGGWNQVEMVIKIDNCKFKMHITSDYTLESCHPFGSDGHVNMSLRKTFKSAICGAIFEFSPSKRSRVVLHLEARVNFIIEIK